MDVNLDTWNLFYHIVRFAQLKWAQNSVWIGVLCMVDDTLAVADCRNQNIKKNSLLNSFIETQKITLSKERSLVFHYGKESKCALPCPTIRVQV